MTDVFSKKKRSLIMSKIRSKNTQIEISLRKLLSKDKIKYRIHYAKLPGKPDIAFPKKKLAVFIDSHFWHGYDWKNLKKKLKQEYWQWKIPYNMKRDKDNNKKLKAMGWKVLRFWEREIKKSPQRCVDKIRIALATR